MHVQNSADPPQRDRTPPPPETSLTPPPLTDPTPPPLTDPTPPPLTDPTPPPLTGQQQSQTKPTACHPKDSDYWVKDLGLTFEDKRVLETDGVKLSDKHMHAAHKLLRIQFPKLQGCNSTLLLQLKSFPSVTDASCSGKLKDYDCTFA